MPLQNIYNVFFKFNHKSQGSARPLSLNKS